MAMMQLYQKWSILAEIWFGRVMLVMPGWVEPMAVGTVGQDSDFVKNGHLGEMVHAAK